MWKNTSMYILRDEYLTSCTGLKKVNIEKSLIYLKYSILESYLFFKVYLLILIVKCLIVFFCLYNTVSVSLSNHEQENLRKLTLENTQQKGCYYINKNIEGF